MTHATSGRSWPKVFSAWLHPSLPSVRDCLIDLGFSAASVGVGAVAWCGEPLALPAAVLFPALWAFAPGRFVAGLTALSYFLAASRGLPVGVSIFYTTDMGVALGFWFAASSLFVLVHTVLWTPQSGSHRPIRYAIAWILMSLPPFGITGWASPITAAGILFPGWGWWGLAATGAGLSMMTTRIWPIPTLLFGTAFALSAMTWSPPKTPEGWIGIDTEFHHGSSGEHAGYEQHLATIHLVQDAATAGHTRIVLPESAFGIWTPTTERFWEHALADLDVTVAGGAIVVTEAGYDNVMVKVSWKEARILYRERMPVPVSMWQPWSTGGASAQVFGNPTGRFAGTSIAPLICYEQLLVWPVLQSMEFEPDVIVATGNGWWTGDTNIVAIQKACAEAWASLFGLPLVMAFNT
ncbi:conjugal transfer protein TraB [Jiella pacifica]|uniref:Conjugal transfer protein TraB n=1 Tax=Jiella pacifica TaxID=2696469 RepID=A0A6N9T8G3_9HYPH|nr:conjugal transfer protein TraB [Jiella pacifica]NDW07703.1 conjugal transfer protein TraB [Jiella pacifica]